MKLLLSNIFTAVLVSAFWIIAYSHPVAPTPSAPKPQATAPTRPVQTALIVGPSGLAIPVAGVKASELSDTFTQARAGGRVHDAIDIMAPEGTPVMAAAPGKVEKLFFSNGGGGITVYVRSDDGNWSYYYAHLHDYAPGLAEGQHVEQGALLAHVGHTGDAVATAPHLHFAISRMAPGDGWWKGAPINPYPLLASAKAGG